MYSINDLQKLSQVTSTNQRFNQDNQRSQTSKDISLRGVTLSFGSLNILNDAHIRLTYGTKYALIGRNGIGKTTLLRCMANNMIPQWTIIRTFLLQQEHEQVDKTPLELVKTSDPEYQSLLNQDIDDLAIDQEMALFDEDDMERRAIEILTELKFTREMMNKPFKDLSGGWRMKTMLGCAAFAQPHLLLLDEPTNHLDLKSIDWLIEYLKTLECTVIVVSHDHDFLDRYCECIIHLTQQQLRYYPGNYSDFNSHRQEKLNEQSNTAIKKKSATGKRLEQLQGPKITKMSKRKAVDTAWVWGGEALLQGEEGQDGKIVNLNFPDPDFSVGNVLVQLKSVGFSYGERILWENVEFSIERNSRIALLGKNGIGKSTLLACIAGVQSPSRGTIVRHHNLRIGYFTQHLIQEIDLTKSAADLLMEKFNIKVQEARDYLGSFGISGTKALERLGVLSGGQKARFVFSMLLFDHPHLLLLDEPTSHLDMEMTEALIGALERFQGSFVVISHHKYFLGRLNCKFYYIGKKKLNFIESIADYMNK